MNIKQIREKLGRRDKKEKSQNLAKHRRDKTEKSGVKLTVIKGDKQ